MRFQEWWPLVEAQLRVGIRRRATVDFPVRGKTLTTLTSGMSPNGLVPNVEHVLLYKYRPRPRSSE
jgi:hypothetical protein